jgi:hypothetical protein
LAGTVKIEKENKKQKRRKHVMEKAINYGVPDAAIKALADGAKVFIGECRGGMADEFMGKGGKVFQQYKIVIEQGPGKSICLNGFLPDGVNHTDWKCPIPVGQRVMGFVTGMDGKRGTVNAVLTKL